jgi:hypothetical protein
VDRYRRAGALDPTLPAQKQIDMIAEHVRRIGDAIVSKARSGVLLVPCVGAERRGGRAA